MLAAEGWRIVYDVLYSWGPLPCARGSMKRIAPKCLSMVVACCSTALCIAQTSPPADLESRRAQFRSAIDAQWQYELKTHPEFATYVGDPRYNDRLSDDSPAAVAAEDEENKRQLALFTGVDSAGFSPEELLNKELMIRDLRQAI